MVPANQGFDAYNSAGDNLDLRLVVEGELFLRHRVPDALLEGIAPILADPTANVTGFHLYLFNAADATETWRRSKLAQLGAVA